MSNCYGNFQLTRSKANVDELQKPSKNDAYFAYVYSWPVALTHWITGWIAACMLVPGMPKSLHVWPSTGILNIIFYKLTIQTGILKTNNKVIVIICQIWPSHDSMQIQGCKSDQTVQWKRYTTSSPWWYYMYETVNRVLIKLRKWLQWMINKAADAVVMVTYFSFDDELLYSCPTSATTTNAHTHIGNINHHLTEH